MKKITYICDKCKREIEDNPIKIFAEEVGREDGDFALKALYPGWQNLDFCKGCADYVVDRVKRMCAKGAPATDDSQSSPEPPPMKEQEKEPRKKIDRGKVMALHKAGWSAAKIADEMNCSDAAIYNILKGGKKDVGVDSKSSGISPADAGSRGDGQ